MLGCRCLASRKPGKGGDVVVEITVVLADEHTVLREGTRRILEGVVGIRVVGEAGDGPAALEEVQRLGPDLLLAGIKMKGMNGLEVAQRLRELGSRTRVIIMTGYDDDHNMLMAMKTGVAGYLSKTVCSHDLIKAIRAVARGDIALDRTFAREAEKIWRGGLSDLALVSRACLTPREKEVLGLVAKGLHNRDIARALGVSPRTVDGHLNSLFAKLNVSTRTGAAMAGINGGWLPNRESGAEES